jgi:hypothetical protein
MLQKIQASRSDELMEKLKALEISLTRADSPEPQSRLGRADRLALATEMQRLQTQLELMSAELESTPQPVDWHGHPGGDIEPSMAFDASQLELTCLQLREQKIFAEIWIAQSRGINTCWQIADRLNRTYRGHGYVTMQPHLTERDLRANREVAAAISEEADREMIDVAFAVATVLNSMGGPQRTWDHEWMTTEHRIEIIGQCFRLLRLVVSRNLQHDSHPLPPRVPRTEEEVFLM